MGDQTVPAMAFLEPSLVAAPDDGTPVRDGTRIRLAASQCRTCHRTTFPALASCPECGGDVQRIALDSEGRLQGFTSVLAPPPDAMVDPPYYIGLVAFDDHDITVMGLLTDAASDVGTRVETVAREVDGRLTYAFRLTGA